MRAEPPHYGDPVNELDRDIAVHPTGPTTYSANLDGGWVVGGGVNGGYLLAVAASALRAHLPAKPDPISVSAFYASAGVPGPAQVRVEVKRDGGSFAIAAAEIWQGDELRVTTLAQVGDLERIGATAWGEPYVAASEPELPPREECVPSSLAPEYFRRRSPMLDRFEMLFHPGQVGWAVGRPERLGVLSAWFRHHDREPDPLGLLQVLDALPPVSFDLGMPGWAPTLEYTCHVRRRPAPGWLKVVQRTRLMEGGMFEEDCEVWDAAGHLVGMARQLARQPRQSGGFA
jgi:acyl-CoA thioesterase